MNPADAETIFGRRLRQERERRGLSTRALADHMQRRGYEWNHNTVLKTETAKRPVRLAEAMTLASILQVAVDSLLRPELDEDKRRLMEELAAMEAERVAALDKVQACRDSLQTAQAAAASAQAEHANAEAEYRNAMDEYELLRGRIQELLNAISEVRHAEDEEA